MLEFVVNVRNADQYKSPYTSTNLAFRKDHRILTPSVIWHGEGVLRDWIVQFTLPLRSVKMPKADGHMWDLDQSAYGVLLENSVAFWRIRHESHTLFTLLSNGALSALPGYGLDLGMIVVYAYTSPLTIPYIIATPDGKHNGEVVVTL